MKNKVQSGHTITVARSSASVSGVPYDLGSGLVGVALGSYDANESGEYATSGVVSLAKEAAAFAIGEAVGWDDGNLNVVDSADGTKDFDLGIAVEVVVSGDSHVGVLINSARGPGPSYS